MYQGGATLIAWGRKKIPRPYEIWSLYSTIVFLIYGWTSIAFFWKLPSWLKILNGWEIAMVIAYILASNLLESLIVLMVFILACIVLPPGWLRADFAIRGTCLMYVFTFWTCVFTLNSLIGFPTRVELLLIVIGLLASIGLTMYLVERNVFVHRLMRALSNRAIIFLYLWIPPSLIGLITVFIKFIEAGLKSP